MEIRFLYGEPAALFGKWVIITDLHIGAPRSPSWKVVANMVERLMEEEGKKRLLILGDIKASVAKTEGDAGKFIREIGSRYDLHICKGNHDGGIEKYNDYCTVYGPGGVTIKLDGQVGCGNDVGCVGFLHGHAWPDSELLTCRTIVMGHQHPRAVLGSREWKWAEKVWIVGNLNRKGLVKHYGRGTKIAKNIVLISMPSFYESYPLDSGERKLSPLMREDIFIKKSAKIYLLNGIQLE